MTRNKSDKQEWMEVPDWLKKVKDEDGASSVFALMFSWDMNGTKQIDNLEDYIRESFDDLSDEQVEEVANLLIEHGIIEK